MTHPAPPADRLARAAAATAAAGLDALLITPGPDLRYLTGYDAVALERLTCLIVPADGDPHLIVPELEQPAALASPAPALGITVTPWSETADPYRLLATHLTTARRVALDDQMPAAKVLALRDALPAAEQHLASTVLRPLRIRKTPDEVDALRRAGAAIDTVHRAVPDLLRPGRTERDIARDIADAIISAGHTTVDFVIVGSGPNGASPHHDVSDRALQPGDPVVVDIGGTMPDGYRSDSTRTYSLGQPPADFLAYYDTLRHAQDAQVDAVRPGIPAETIDAVGRDILTDAGYGDRFIHRTGHGIGLETHEDPYIVTGNTLPLEPGMAFSVEPGVYLPGRHGARIEDIVVVTDTGAERLNNTPRTLTVID